MREQKAVYSVTQVNQYIKSLLDSDGALSGIFVRGELSNYKTYPSGHHYFTLKDAEGALRCVMFKRDAMGLRFRPENGMKVIASGRVTVFPRDGQYQLYCNTLTPDGIGDLHIAFEQLKQRLYQEGLFELEHKKAIPRFSHRIALITSPAGAAVRDMLRILDARWPLSEILILPVRVQGAESPDEICAALAWANRFQVADLIITGRGGGSMEDLWAFNDERVARSIYASQIPVISAVGHEPDVTIADFVADLRAATPSNAAELAVPDQNDVAAWLVQADARLNRAIARRLQQARNELKQLERSRALSSPQNHIEDRRILLDYQRDKLIHGLSATLAASRERFVRLSAALDALSPLKVLGRGYSITQNEAGKVIHSIYEVSAGDLLKLNVSNGTIICSVNGTDAQEQKKEQ